MNPTLLALVCGLALVLIAAVPTQARKKIRCDIDDDRRSENDALLSHEKKHLYGGCYNKPKAKIAKVLDQPRRMLPLIKYSWDEWSESKFNEELVLHYLTSSRRDKCSIIYDRPLEKIAKAKVYIFGYNPWYPDIINMCCRPRLVTKTKKNKKTKKTVKFRAGNWYRCSDYKPPAEIAIGTSTQDCAATCNAIGLSCDNNLLTSFITNPSQDELEELKAALDAAGHVGSSSIQQNAGMAKHNTGLLCYFSQPCIYDDLSDPCSVTSSHALNHPVCYCA
eukprot:m.58716 g.58716  ORF g.58716 m.58716 type:complete len:278 (+) comp11714_c0_seq1:178-1011(+)